MECLQQKQTLCGGAILGATVGYQDDISEILDNAARLTRFFALVGAVGILGFLKPAGSNPGIGTAAAVLMGVGWIGLWAAARWWSRDPSKEERQRLIARLSVFTILVSLVALIVAIRAALTGGFTIDIGESGSQVRGAWMLWLFPSLCCLASAGSAYGARTLGQQSRELLHAIRGSLV